MAIRSRTNTRRESLKKTIRMQCESGEWKAGEAVPSVREMVTQYGVSKEVVMAALRDLVDEGVLFTEPRVGTFVGRAPAGGRNQLFIVVAGKIHLPEREVSGRQMRAGFEEFIAQRGASAAWLEYEDFLALHEHGLPNLAGVFDLSCNLPDGWNTGHTEIPMVGMGNPAWAHQQRSIVAFDDERGGYDATRHLIERGHRSIAYLGVHCQGGDHGLYWSQERERGWRRAMNSTGVLCDHLAFLPPRFLSSANGLSTWHEQREMAMMAAQVMLPLLQSRVVTGVVAANDLAASALMQMLRDSSTRFALWPAIVSFDNELFDIFAAAPERSHLLTSLRLPWEEVGRAAAELLWERAHGRTQHTPLHRVVPMQLIPRFSCRADWTVQLQRLTESPRRRTGRENTRECIASEHAGV